MCIESVSSFSLALALALPRSLDGCRRYFYADVLMKSHGKGLGTYVLGMLADEYPDVYRFVTAGACVRACACVCACV